MIIDAFMFFNELELLEIRLNELDPVVDKFVIAESLERHGSANLKPAFIRDNWHIVKPFEHKIKYVLLPHLEPPYTDSASGWGRENFQRNSLMASALELSTSPDDILILSDCDEIPRATTIKENLSLGRIHRLELELFYYNVNRYVGLWDNSTIGTVAQYINEGGTQKVRSDTIVRPHTKYGIIRNAGWHFSYFGGIDRMRTKVSSFAEAYLDSAVDFRKRTDAEIVQDIRAGEDIYHRGIYPPFTRRETNDPRLPAYFLKNVSRYPHLTENFFRNGTYRLD